jgi:hypothetical protein
MIKVFIYIPRAGKCSVVIFFGMIDYFASILSFFRKMTRFSMAGKGKKEEESADKMLPPEQKPRPR